MGYDLATPYSVGFLLVTALLLGEAAFALRHRDRQEARLLVPVLVAMALWSLGDAVRFGAPNVAHILFWDRVADAGIILLGPAIFLFAAGYTGRHRWLQRKYVATLLLVSGGILLVAVTNPFHGLWASVQGLSPQTAPPVFREGRGLLWYCFAIWGPGLAFAAYYLVFQRMVESRGAIYRSQALLVGIGILTPIFLTALYLLTIFPWDPTPIGFLVSGISFGLAIFRFDLFDVAPVARDTVVSTSNNGILVVDANGTVADVNDSFARLLDVSREALLGRSLDDVREAHPELVDPVVDARDATERVTVREDDQRTHYDIDVSPIQTEVEADAGSVIVYNDVTAPVERKNELLERTAELERQNDRLDRFASLVSHDLRNPLHTASSYLELAEERGRSEDFEAIRAAHDRMDAIIDDLLTIARAGQHIEETEQVPVADLARESWDHVETDGADLEVALPADWTVAADPDRLRHVFENLFRNAVEHNDPAPTLRVAPLTGDNRGEPIGFVVEDDGAGLPEADREELLEYGFTEREEGTGFGLAIVAEVIAAHGWDLELGESPAGGARFEVRTARTGEPRPQ